MLAKIHEDLFVLAKIHEDISVLAKIHEVLSVLAKKKHEDLSILATSLLELECYRLTHRNYMVLC